MTSAVQSQVWKSSAHIRNIPSPWHHTDPRAGKNTWNRLTFVSESSAMFNISIWHCLWQKNKEIHNRSALNLLCGKHRKHWHTHRLGTTHQAASVHTHCSWVLVAGCAVKHSAKVEVEVVTQGQAAEFTGVRAWQRRYSVSGSLWYYGKIGEAKRQRGRWLNSKNNQNMEKESKLNEQQQSPGI